MPDADGYPTEEELERISNWPADEIRGWFEFIGTIWHHRDWGFGYHEPYTHPTYNYLCFRLSTGGWSGNEEIISAMKRNPGLWMWSWVSSRRGGHYEFRHPDSAKRPALF